jgi:hypothetical protein
MENPCTSKQDEDSKESKEDEDGKESKEEAKQLYVFSIKVGLTQTAVDGLEKDKKLDSTTSPKIGWHVTGIKTDEEWGVKPWSGDTDLPREQPSSTALILVQVNHEGVFEILVGQKKKDKKLGFLEIQVPESEEDDASASASASASGSASASAPASKFEALLSQSVKYLKTLEILTHTAESLDETLKTQIRENQVNKTRTWPSAWTIQIKNEVEGASTKTVVVFLTHVYTVPNLLGEVAQAPRRLQSVTERTTSPFEKFLWLRMDKTLATLKQEHDLDAALEKMLDTPDIKARFLKLVEGSRPRGGRQKLKRLPTRSHMSMDTVFTRLAWRFPPSIDYTPDTQTVTSFFEREGREHENAQRPWRAQGPWEVNTALQRFMKAKGFTKT